MENHEIQRHGNGIYSKHRKRLNGGRGGPVYFVVYYWNGRRVTEKVEADKDGRYRLKTAQRLKALREKEKHAPDFVPPHHKKRGDKARAETEVERRRPLLFETAAKSFLDECGEEYARPEDVRSAFRLEPGPNTKQPGQLALAFRGRHLDEIKRLDIRQYYIDRVSNTGPFASWPRSVSRRAPEQEITFLSAETPVFRRRGSRLG